MKAPLAWPKNSLSTRPAEIALQLTFTRGRCAARALVVDGPSDQLLAGTRLAGDEDGGVGGRHLLDPPEHRQQRLAAPDHLREVVLAVDLLLQVGVLPLQAGRQCRDLLVGQHVLDRQRDLASDLLQEGDVGVGILGDGGAGHGQGAQAAPPHDERHDRERAHAIGQGLCLGRVLLLALEVTSNEWAPLLEHQAHVALGVGDLQAGDEIGRGQRRVEHQQAEDAPLRVVQEDGGPLERHHPPKGGGDRAEEVFSREVGDERVADPEQGAITLRVVGQLRGGLLHHVPAFYLPRAARGTRDAPGCNGYTPGYRHPVAWDVNGRGWGDV